MRILIAALHRPVTPTGVCRHAVNLAKCLAENDVVEQVILVIGSWQKNYFETAFPLKSEKIKLIETDIKNTSLSRNIWFLLGLPKLAKEISPDIVHLSFPMPFLQSRFSCPVVATIHDLYPYQFPENFGYRQVLFNRLFLKQCIRGSDGLICVSKTTLGYLKKYFPQVVSSRKRTDIGYNFVDFKQLESKSPKEIDSARTHSFILCVGQHRKNKNIDLLIRAYSSLMQKNRLRKDTQLILVGSTGPETEHLNQLIHELFLEESVVFLSAIADEELCWLYQNCELFVIPSSLEGFCIPLVEALHFSCKVVCSDIPIFKEIGSSGCTYFDLGEDSVKNLAQSMIQALASEPAGNNDIDARFSKRAIASQYLKFYSELLAEQKKSKQS